MSIKYGIIIPVYNKPIEMIQRCLNSIYASVNKLGSKPSITVFIVDDCSKDISYIDQLKFDSNVEIRFNKNSENKGLFYNRFTGLFLSNINSCQYTMFIDPDDYYSEDTFSIIDAELNKTPDIDILNFDIEGVYADCHRDKAIFPEEHKNYTTLNDIITHQAFIFHSMCDKVFSAKVVEYLVSKLDPIILELPRINNCEDLVYSSLYFDMEFSYRHISELLYIYEFGDPNNISNNSDFNDTLKNMLKVFTGLRSKGILSRSKYLLGMLVSELRLKQDMSHFMKAFKDNVFDGVEPIPTRSSTEYCKWVEY